jgi:phosphoribosylanthranilate isomerase
VAIFVKICGVTSVEDATKALDLRADGVGINLVSGSKRQVVATTARRIAAGIAGKATSIAVVADLDREQLDALQADLGVDRLQLHGHEAPSLVASLLPAAYKAVRIGGQEDVGKTREYVGEPILLDARVAGELGGTGQTFDWTLVRDLASSRPVLLAGGLTPANVRRAVETVRPWGVDVSSGVEVSGDPRRKDASLMRRFIRAARSVRSG